MTKRLAIVICRASVQRGALLRPSFGGRRIRRQQAGDDQGTVSRVDWTNPHSRIYVDVKDASGKVTTWNFELAARSALTRQGWTGKSVKIGDTVTGRRRSRAVGRDRRPRALRSCSADGTKVFSGANDNNQKD